mmetsp:Transcript_120957/g.240959  ORF Transcript_120957/g.240959 Transcript_120957/m.240959 type:complete len:305 (-) Transcript_120957:59-973(-)
MIVPLTAYRGYLSSRCLVLLYCTPGQPSGTFMRKMLRPVLMPQSASSPAPSSPLPSFSECCGVQMLMVPAWRLRGVLGTWMEGAAPAAASPSAFFGDSEMIAPRRTANNAESSACMSGSSLMSIRALQQSTTVPSCSTAVKPSNQMLSSKLHLQSASAAHSVTMFPPRSAHLTKAKAPLTRPPTPEKNKNTCSQSSFTSVVGVATRLNTADRAPLLPAQPIPRTPSSLRSIVPETQAQMPSVILSVTSACCRPAWLEHRAISMMRRTTVIPYCPYRPAFTSASCCNTRKDNGPLNEGHQLILGR